MPENNNNNTSGSKIPASTEGLSRQGSVSPEDLRKYNLAPSENESTPANSDSVVGKDVGTSSDFVNNVPTSEPSQPNRPVTNPENVDHLQASKQNDEKNIATGAAVGAGVAAGAKMASSMQNNNTDANANEAKTREEAARDSEDKPWENTFDSDEDESGHVSRAVSKSKQRGNHTLVAILVIILIALMFIPATMYFFKGDDDSNNLGSGQTEQSVEKQDKDTAKKSNAKSSSNNKKKSSDNKKKSSSKKKTSSDNKSNSDNSGTVNQTNEETASDTTADTSGQTSQSASTTTSANSAQSSQASSATNSQATGSTASQGSSTGSSSYTVKQGEGWYRAAVNSGTTIEALKGLNPGVSTLSPGTQLRTK